jgi:hypothetical protein
MVFKDGLFLGMHLLRRGLCSPLICPAFNGIRLIRAIRGQKKQSALPSAPFSALVFLLRKTMLDL